MRAPLVAFAFAVTALAGCVENSDLGDKNPNLEGIFDLLPSTEHLWYNPQTMSHPAFGFPTLTQPAIGKNGTNVPEFWKPIPAAQLPSHIMGLEHVTKAPKANQGAGMSVFGSLAVVPGFTGAPTYVYDISDPTKPVVLSKLKGS